MGHYAKVPTITDGKGIVEEVVTADAAFIQSGALGDPFQWIKTSYNTRGGVHYDLNSQTRSPDQSKALRANYAGIGYTYDAVNDVFYAPRPENQYGPFNSWTLSGPSWEWAPPIPYPDDGNQYIWDDPAQEWLPFPTPTA
jgi:hypothetical protein